MTTRRLQLEFGPLFLLLGVGCVVVLAYESSFRSMFDILRFDSNSQGLLVFPISVYLLWRSRAQFDGAQLRPWVPGIALLGALTLAWACSREIGLQVGEHLAVVLLIPAAAATMLGLDLTRRALFPLLFLLVAVPIGDAFIPYLMSLTADVAATLLRAVGVPVYRDGNLMTLPGGEFEIAEVCSGLRSLIAGTTIALLFSYLTFRRGWTRLAFVVATDVVLMLVNGIRAFVVMLVASATHMRVLAGNDHVIFGWILFGCVMVALFWWGSRFADVPVGAGEPAGATAPGGALTRAAPVALLMGLVMLAMTAQPFGPGTSIVWLVPGGALLVWLLSRFASRGPTSPAAHPGRHVADPYRRPQGAFVILGALAVLASGPMVLGGGSDDASAEVRKVPLPAIGGCSADEWLWGGPRQPQWSRPEIGAVGSYHCGGAEVNVLAAGFSRKARDKELIGRNDRAVPASWRQRSDTERSAFRARSGETTEVNQVVAEYGDRQSLIWYWFALGQRRTRSPLMLELLTLVARLRGEGAMPAAYWLETPIDASVARSRERLAVVAPPVDLMLTSAGAPEGLR